MSGLFGGKQPKQEAPPPLEPPVPMPDPEDKLAKIDEQKRIARRFLASGRQSTLVSQNQKEKLGG